MTHTYQITGMTCSSCERKIRSKLLTLPSVTQVEVSKKMNSATVTMDKHLSIDYLQDALGGANSAYQISALPITDFAGDWRSWVKTYQPILLIFGYITLISIIGGRQSPMKFMQIFMAGFFLSFSFFKLLDLRAFADSYSRYDVVAKLFKPWGKIYAFIELGLGFAYVTDFSPIFTNLTTLIVMSVSLIGVLQSVLNKKQIQCACLGAVFNLPMSTLTIVEDVLMIVMSAIMLILI